LGISKTAMTIFNMTMKVKAMKGFLGLSNIKSSQESEST
jgi:hypothetical protein